MAAPPSLLKTAYHACNQIERNKFDSLETLDADMQFCCSSLFKIIKINEKLNSGNNRKTKIIELNRRYKDMFEAICETAALKEHIDCLKLAHEIGVEWGDCMACSMAAVSGSLECLKYARENGCPWDERTCAGAASNGNLECLKYARKNGCPFDEWTCAFAATNGSLECLMYARENGCPWDESTCIRASMNGHIACLEYALENGCPWNEPQ